MYWYEIACWVLAAVGALSLIGYVYAGLNFFKANTLKVSTVKRKTPLNFTPVLIMLALAVIIILVLVATR